MNRSLMAFCEACTRVAVVFVRETPLCGPCFCDLSQGTLRLSSRPPLADARGEDKEMMIVLARLAAALEASQRNGSVS